MSSTVIKEKTLNELWNEKGYSISKGINLIISPCGSGKTYFTFNTVIKSEKLENIIYLCDTRNLKNAVALDKEYSHLCRFYNRLDENNVVDGSETIFGEGFAENKITVMTYAQFGVLAQSNIEAFQSIKMIICDEAHQAIDYHRKFDDSESKTYRIAIATINKISTQAKVVLLTATPSNINNKKIPYVFDFTQEANIKRLKEKQIITYYTYKDMSKILEEFKELNAGRKTKMLIYTDRISTVRFFVDSCIKLGLKPCGLWSLNNKYNIMSDYQLMCLKSVIEESLIPEEIDVLIINASLQTGVNIKNNNIEWVLVNSTNKTTQIQARSRVREDIDRLYLKTEKSIKSKEIALCDQWLNVPLTSNDKKLLCQQINQYDQRGRLLKWKGISSLLTAQGYSIKNYSIRINGIITRVSKISR